MSWNPSRLLGIRMDLLLGETKALPAPAMLAEALQDVQIELGDEGNDGFQLTFGAGRKAGVLTTDSPVFTHPLLLPFSRVVVQVSFGAQSEVLIDGFITHRQASPGDEPGSTTLTVTGEDVRVMMDIEERTVTHDGLAPEMRVYRILGEYQSLLGIAPDIRPPRNGRTPSLDRIPVQHGTDLQYLRKLAREHAYVFYVEPGKMPNLNSAYWGPPPKISTPQPALTVNMGPDTNARINFSYDALKLETSGGTAMDPKTRTLQPVSALLDLGRTLAQQPARDFQRGIVRKTLARHGIGGDVMDVLDASNAAVARSEDALSASADINVAEYGHVLRPRRIVGVRGAGRQLDGDYYVKRVSHAIRRGSYTQRCTLTRESLGALAPVVAT
ncbi:hypothetical protein E0H93_34855 [Rhizobium leguminosarum bv. viciae]|uniref:hypothetical protein n=1 Tax=Rhizobium leguminosarum TaxID=384 RepID=UPI00104088F1|nr:hypothetical protein [Rhizobium leguminosarum]MBY5530190.1 hypothetical protein [Rhizobium leguminosarum]NKK29621.1 hypothetical protein [Rhizobium leguminosarum bv. viciae]TBY30662.1 hypothetical protein E0H55_20485 [Rhizobium leguminosarum bv. viciae]TBY35728.1 hypothetical protein E0H60_22900 [Rhizobium leguminosarum bv. viciae]TBZ54198.1 hypothetical protein E0H42_14245 [Rhizobium leguminosarum bv. viciae]